MQISNRWLWGIAIVSALSAVGLVFETPVVSQIDVIRVKVPVSAGRIDIASQTEQGSVSLYEFSRSKDYVPWSLRSFVDGRAVRHEVSPGYLRMGDLLAGDRDAGAGDQVRLSRLLEPNERAVTIRSDDLVSLGYALLPGDVIDIELGPDRVPNVRVLAVGSRTENGWSSPGPHDSRFSTVTLAVSAANARRIAELFSRSGAGRPQAILHSSRTIGQP